MSESVSQKPRRVRLVPAIYARLRETILARDGWSCQICGGRKHLDVHHMKRRGALGDDSETNLITLCRKCHQHVHGPASEISKI
jgi:5-methylcytosine-specific restriction endonuclease McrA